LENNYGWLEYKFISPTNASFRLTIQRLETINTYEPLNAHTLSQTAPKSSNSLSPNRFVKLSNKDVLWQKGKQGI
jgi:hypothetical protein